MLPKEIYLCEGARVMLLFNVCSELGLSNGSCGTLRDFVYDKEDALCMPPNLPKYVWVEFDSGTYRGPSFFPNDSTRGQWVPISSTSAYGGTSVVASSRTMLPLKLCWAFTPWKVQGQTIPGKLLATLGVTEKEAGLSYVVFS